MPPSVQIWRVPDERSKSDATKCLQYPRSAGNCGTYTLEKCHGASHDFSKVPEQLFRLKQINGSVYFWAGYAQMSGGGCIDAANTAGCNNGNTIWHCSCSSWIAMHWELVMLEPPPPPPPCCADAKGLAITCKTLRSAHALLDNKITNKTASLEQQLWDDILVNMNLAVFKSQQDNDMQPPN